MQLFAVKKYAQAYKPAELNWGVNSHTELHIIMCETVQGWDFLWRPHTVQYISIVEYGWDTENSNPWKHKWEDPQKYNKEALCKKYQVSIYKLIDTHFTTYTISYM